MKTKQCDAFPLKSCSGPPAEGEDQYFPRPAISNKICRAIANGENILLSAPRRIGKTSLLKSIQAKGCPADLADLPVVYKYMIIQSIESSESFFRQLYHDLICDDEIYGAVDSYIKQASHSVKSFFNRLRGVSLEGMKMSAENNIDYYRECETLFSHLKSKKLVLFIDEFPDALSNIHRNNRHKAIHFLQQHRDLRQKFNKKNVQFVYTGSTGLRNVVNKIGKPDLINDISEISVPPFSRDEARCLIESLVLGFQQENQSFELITEQIDYILNKITWYLPYYLQTIVKALFERFEEGQGANMLTAISDIDAVLLEMTKSKSPSSHYFENWIQRLKRAFDPQEFQVAKNILSHIAVNHTIDKATLKQLTAPLNTDSDGGENVAGNAKRFIMNTLEYDGYINEAYQFNSNLLKNWWLENVID